jgi:hypothetical protein
MRTHKDNATNGRVVFSVQLEQHGKTGEIPEENTESLRTGFFYYLLCQHVYIAGIEVLIRVEMQT